MLSAISKSLEIIIIIENLSSKCIWESQLFYKERWLVLEFSAILEFRPNVSTAKSIWLKLVMMGTMTDILSIHKNHIQNFYKSAF